MKPLRYLIVALVLGLTVWAAAAHAHGYRTRSGDGTAYCDNGLTAAGTRTHIGIVANNEFALGTWVELVRPRRVMARRYFRIEDTGGPGFALDFWNPSCSWGDAWGRRPVRFRAVPRHHLYRGLPEGGWHWSPK